MPRSFEFLTIPETPDKPRAVGRTCVADTGQPNSYVEGTLELWASAVDVVKISSFTLTAEEGALRRKIEIYESYGVETQAGGPVLEVARLQGKLKDTLTRIRDMGFSSIEISSEALPTTYSRDEEEKVASLAQSLGLKMHGEVGKKFATGDPLRLESGRLNVEGTVAAIEMYLDIGCDFVYLEGHLLRAVIGDNAEKGDANRADFRQLTDRLGLDKVFFEVPFTFLPYSSKRILQHWLVMTFGPEVNVANVLVSEVPELEVIRTGMFPVFGAKDGDHPFIQAAAAEPTGWPSRPWWWHD